ncbi:MAG: precorrin-6A/cobalt-precorrin-6A reductase [Ruminococcus callidus]
MKGLRLAVIAGTSEATDLIAVLPEQDCVTAFAATEYGKTILEGSTARCVWDGWMRMAFAFALRGMDAVIDASHPFAQVVTETVRQVCAELELPYFRLGRQKMTYDYSRVIRVESKEQAAACLAAIPGNILLTTGVNTLSFLRESDSGFQHPWLGENLGYAGFPAGGGRLQSASHFW